MIRLTVVLLSLISVPAFAQDYGAMLQQQLQQSEMLSQQMRQMEGQIINQNMQNPQVQQMYQQHLAQGGQMTFQQFAYQYAATGGFTPQGMNAYRQSERQIQQNEQNAIQRYRENQMQNGQVLQQMQEQNDRWARQRGNVLSGKSDYVDPRTGMRHNLPNTVQPNTAVYDQGNDQMYYNDQSNNYYRQDPSGYWQELEEEE